MRRISHKSSCGDRARLIVDRAAADAQHLGLLLDGKIVLRVDHRFALSSPALVSAPSKKSFSSVSSPILACRVLRSTVARRGLRLRFAAEDPAAPSRSWLFHCVIWLACTSNCCANSESVFSPLMAAKATFALKAAVWFRADVCSSALLIPAILGCGRTEPPLNPLSEFAGPALSLSIIRALHIANDK